jgi:hypothetical protein
MFSIRTVANSSDLPSGEMESNVYSLTKPSTWNRGIAARRSSSALDRSYTLRSLRALPVLHRESWARRRSCFEPRGSGRSDQIGTRVCSRLFPVRLSVALPSHLPSRKRIGFKASDCRERHIRPGQANDIRIRNRCLVMRNSSYRVIPRRVRFPYAKPNYCGA